MKCDVAPVSHFAMIGFVLGTLVMVFKGDVVCRHFKLLTLMLPLLGPPNFQVFLYFFAILLTLPPFLLSNVASSI